MAIRKRKLGSKVRWVQTASPYGDVCRAVQHQAANPPPEVFPSISVTLDGVPWFWFEASAAVAGLVCCAWFVA